MKRNTHVTSMPFFFVVRSMFLTHFPLYLLTCWIWWQCYSCCAMTATKHEFNIIYEKRFSFTQSIHIRTTDVWTDRPLCHLICTVSKCAPFRALLCFFLSFVHLTLPRRLKQTLILDLTKINIHMNIYLIYKLAISSFCCGVYYSIDTKYIMMMMMNASWWIQMKIETKKRRNEMDNKCDNDHKCIWHNQN